MQRRKIEILLSAILLVVAVGLLTYGFMHSHKVYDKDTESFGIVSFVRISEADMIVDATFSGVTRRDDRLFSTYDRTETRGKRACPT